MESTVISSTKQKTAKFNPKHEPVIPSFLQKTYGILEDPKLAHIISWSEDGQALVIKDTKQFAERVLPSFFKHSNLSSFIRQLNMYDFRKLKSKLYDLMFAHDMFQAGKIELLRLIKRKNIDAAASLTRNKINVDDATERDPEVLYQENQVLKRVQREIAEQVRSLEGQIQELTKENVKLTADMHASQQNSLKDSTKLQSYLPVGRPFDPQGIRSQVQYTTQRSYMSTQLMNGMPSATYGQQPQAGFPLISNAVDHQNIYSQHFPSAASHMNLPPQSGQMGYVIIPTMNLYDQSRSIPGNFQAPFPYVYQNNVTVLPLSASNSKTNITLKNEEQDTKCLDPAKTGNFYIDPSERCQTPNASLKSEDTKHTELLRNNLNN